MIFVSELNFDCERFEFDAGDCVFPEPETDCDGQELGMLDYEKLGDGYCDAGMGKRATNTYLLASD